MGSMMPRDQRAPRVARDATALRYTGRHVPAAQHQALQGLRRRVQYAVPADDNRERATCTACATIHYENPLNVVGTVPVWDDQVLLCRRNIEPRYGLWTLPAGFMELGETTAEGAVRETIEEAGARIELQGLFTLLNVVRVGQVHLFYRARLLDTDFAPGPETIEAQLFAEDEMPWDELAFRTVRRTLERYFADRATAVSACTPATSAEPRPALAHGSRAGCSDHQRLQLDAAGRDGRLGLRLPAAVGRRARRARVRDAADFTPMPASASRRGARRNGRSR